MRHHNRDEIELELLLLRYRRGDADALRILVRRFERPLFYFIRKIVQNEADAWDALQKTWLRVFSALPQAASERSLKAWLYRVARNAALNHVRDESRHATSEFNDSTEPDESAGLEFSSEDAEEIHRALDELLRHDREVLTLYFLKELTTGEVADVLEIPRGTVKWRLQVAKRNLRKLLEKQDE